MPAPPPDVLPPIEPSDYRLESFRWCQILYLFARELVRSPNALDWNEAISEAKAVSDLMQDSGAIITPTPWMASPGFTDLVHWPSMVCAANAYASMPPGQRQYIRDRIAEGMPPVAILAIGAGGCDRKVLADEEYLPVPPCLPSEGAKAGWVALGAFAATIGVMLFVDQVLRKM